MQKYINIKHIPFSVSINFVSTSGVLLYVQVVCYNQNQEEMLTDMVQYIPLFEEKKGKACNHLNYFNNALLHFIHDYLKSDQLKLQLKNLISLLLYPTTECHLSNTSSTIPYSHILSTVNIFPLATELVR